MKKALEELYGGEEEHFMQTPGITNTPFKFTKHSNAYMLVYIRESDKDKIMCLADEMDITRDLRERLKREQEEKKRRRKEKAEAHLYTIVKVACDEDFAWQIGRNLIFDLVDHEEVRSFRVQKRMPFSVFKEEAARVFGIPVQCQRFWLWAKRQNNTYRPSRPLAQLEEAETVGHLRDVSNKVPNADLNLFLEIELGSDFNPILPPIKDKDDILLFCKLYVPENKELRYAGRLFVKGTGKPIDILSKLNEMVGYAPDEDIELYEEIKFQPHVMCERIDKRSTFKSSQLVDGDIICFQKSPLAQCNQQVNYPDVRSFFVYHNSRQDVFFRSLERPDEDRFLLNLSKLNTYDEVVKRLAHRLGVDEPSKIRITSHNTYSQQPRPHPVEYRGVNNLLEMLQHYNQVSDILYYEVLDMPLPELQGLRTLRLGFRRATNNEIVIHNIRLPKESFIADVLEDLRMKADISHTNAEFRLLEVLNHKIDKILPSGETVESISDNCGTLRAEEIPEEEKSLGPHDVLIHLCHFMSEEKQNQLKIQNFGEPFLMVIHEDETLANIKIRVQKRLHVPDEEFSKWKFAFISQDQVDYLEDSEILFSRFQRSGVDVALEPYLGLEHVDNPPKRSLTANQYRPTYEKAVKIYN